MGVVAVIGAGVMGETLVSGLLRSGRRTNGLVLAERRTERAEELRERYGVEVLDNVHAAQQADTLRLVVKPQDMNDVLDEIAPGLDSSTLVISPAAGIATPSAESRRPPNAPLVRALARRPAAA